MDTTRAIKVLNMIADDMENDVKHFDSQPFTGKSVGTQLGQQAAAITALTDIIKGLIEEKE